MAKTLTRLTEPMVRENGVLRPATWDEALDRAAAGIRAAVQAGGPNALGIFSLLEGDQRGELRRAEVRARGHRHEQHRQLQPHLTRSQRRRSGDSVRSGRRHQLVPGDRGDGRHRPVGLERPRDAPDLLPPRPQGRAQRRAPVRDRPAPHRLGPVGRRLARDRRRHRHRPLEHDRARDHPRRACTTASSSSARRRASTSTRRRSRSGRSSAASARPACPPTLIRELAHTYARADRAEICWTLGITEHHNAVDNVFCLINLAPAHRPRRPLRLGPEPAPRPEQRPGRRRHGRDPQQAAGLPGHRVRRTTPASGSTRPGASRSRRSTAGT